jgi:hypothetical protein
LNWYRLKIKLHHHNTLKYTITWVKFTLHINTYIHVYNIDIDIYLSINIKIINTNSWWQFLNSIFIIKFNQEHYSLVVVVIIEPVSVLIKFDNDDGSEQRTVVTIAANTIEMSKCISSTLAHSEHYRRSDSLPYRLWRAKRNGNRLREGCCGDFWVSLMTSIKDLKIHQRFPIDEDGTQSRPHEIVWERKENNHDRAATTQEEEESDREQNTRCSGNTTSKKKDEERMRERQRQWEKGRGSFSLYRYQTHFSSSLFLLFFIALTLSLSRGALCVFAFFFFHNYFAARRVCYLLPVTAQPRKNNPQVAAQERQQST